MTMDRCLAQADVAAELGLVHELAEPQAGRAHQAAEVGQGSHRRQLAEIALEVGLRVAGEPEAAVPSVRQVVGRNGIATRANRLSPIVRLVFARASASAAGQRPPAAPRDRGEGREFGPPNDRWPGLGFPREPGRQGHHVPGSPNKFKEGAARGSAARRPRDSGLGGLLSRPV